MTNLFKPKSVDSIMSVFTSTIASLEKAAADHEDRARKLNDKRAAIQVEQAIAVNEAARANALVAKLNKLVG